MKVCQKFEKFDDAASPLVQAIAVGGDGIQTIEQVGERKLERCTLYKDKGIPKEMRFTEYDVFAQNQWSESVTSWGPNGTLLPHGNNSYSYKSLIDSEGLGIVCIDDRIWASNYWYARATQDDYSTIIIEFWFRPREINKSDLLLQMMKRNCCRPCDEPETMFELPCKSACKENCGLKDTLEVQDDEDVVLPTGTVKGKQYKDRHQDRVEYNGCLEVCISGDTGSGEPAVVKIDPTQNTVKIDKASAAASGIDLNWISVMDQYTAFSRKYFDQLNNQIRNYKNINQTEFDNAVTIAVLYDKVVISYLGKLSNETPDTKFNLYQNTINGIIDDLAEHTMDDEIFKNDPTKPECISKNVRNINLSARIAYRPKNAMGIVCHLAALNMLYARLRIKYTQDNTYNLFPAESNLTSYPYSFEDIICEIPALFMNNTSPFGDNEYSRFLGKVQSFLSHCVPLRNKDLCIRFFQDGKESAENSEEQMGPTPREEDGRDETETDETVKEHPKPTSGDEMDADEEEGPPQTQTRE